jgi:hypothetical protein
MTAQKVEEVLERHAAVTYARAGPDCGIEALGIARVVEIDDASSAAAAERGGLR